MDDRGADVNCVLAGDVMVCCSGGTIGERYSGGYIVVHAGARTGRINGFAVDVYLPAGKTCVFTVESARQTSVLWRTIESRSE